ncbi:Receptor-like protein 6 [Citrus sinensis]|uniref:Receptor-like protein 6 n=1 Tax=Citrus sinensis TaxID=2711 RepID=A0ACB8JD34_CITSI|nr:Receptor-like protein 6 [Citrus sinensis]
MKNSFIFDVDSTPPAKMSQWSDSTNCCDWTGVDCDEAGHVIGLDLSAEPILIGRLENASGLFSLQYMQSQFGFHSLLRIPCAIQLSSFRSYKSSPGKLTVTLSVLRLHDNHAASWQVPEFVANLLNLTNLDLSQCDLRGKYPEKILQVSTLETLDLSYNPLLQGSLPNFPKNSYLQNLNLANTSFSGILPDPIGILKYLTRVDLRSCSFTGPIPTSTTNLTQLFHVDFSSNHFSGPIPSFHDVPRSLFLLPILEILLLSNNQFENQLPELSNVSSFVLSDLDLSGSSSEEISLACHQILPTSITLNNNFISIPADIGNFMSRTYFFATANNSLTGFIPESVCKATYFQILDLSNNNLSGTIPVCLITNSSTTLGVLNLGRNNLNGTLSDIIFPRNCGLHILDLSGNQLQGVVPKSLANCNMLQIESLDLSMNNLSGKIPAQLASLNFLSVLNLSYNNLVGQIPTGTQLQSFSPTSYEGNKGLYGPPLTNDSQTRPPEFQPSPPPASSDEIDWFFIAMSIGFAVGFGAAVSPLMFSVQGSRLCWENLCLPVRAGTSSLGYGTGLKVSLTVGALPKIPRG